MLLNAHLISWIVYKVERLSLYDMIGCQLYHSLGHRRNVSCIVLFYKYYFGKCSSGLSELIPPPQVFTRNTRLSGRCHALTVETISHRTTHYRENSFFIRTARLWNDLTANTFPECFNISVFKARVNQHFLLSPPSI